RPERAHAAGRAGLGEAHAAHGGSREAVAPGAPARSDADAAPRAPPGAVRRTRSRQPHAPRARVRRGDARCAHTRRARGRRRRRQGRFGERVRAGVTHRELASAAATLGVRTHGELEAVAGAAERVTYAGWRPEPAEVEPVIAQGLAVLDELDADREQDTANPR